MLEAENLLAIMPVGGGQSLSKRSSFHLAAIKSTDTWPPRSPVIVPLNNRNEGGLNRGNSRPEID